jgi:hypothetical protein
MWYDPLLKLSKRMLEFNLHLREQYFWRHYCRLVVNRQKVVSWGYIGTPIFSFLPLPFSCCVFFILENGMKSRFSVRGEAGREVHFLRRTIAAARDGHYFSVSRFLGDQPPSPHPFRRLRILYPPSLLFDRSAAIPSFLQPWNIWYLAVAFRPVWNTKGFWQQCMTLRIIGVDFVYRPVF